MAEYRAADLPEGSVVAGDYTVWIKFRRPTDPDASAWKGTNGSRVTDRYMEDRLAEGAQVLRVGTGKEG